MVAHLRTSECRRPILPRRRGLFCTRYQRSAAEPVCLLCAVGNACGQLQHASCHQRNELQFGRGLHCGRSRLVLLAAFRGQRSGWRWHQCPLCADERHDRGRAARREFRRVRRFCPKTGRLPLSADKFRHPRPRSVWVSASTQRVGCRAGSQPRSKADYPEIILSHAIIMLREFWSA